MDEPHHLSEEFAAYLSWSRSEGKNEEGKKRLGYQQKEIGNPGYDLTATKMSFSPDSPFPSCFLGWFIILSLKWYCSP